jgi:signal transduction histidine kinase
VAVGTFLISVVYLFALRVVGLLPPARWWIGLLRFWVGDGVGISIMMPLLWWLTSPRARGLLRRTVARPESLGYLLLAGVTLWVAFGLGGHNGFKLFYLLFLPVVWAAARQGMAGAIVCAAFVQVGIIVAMRLLHYNAVSVAELQILAMAIAMVGFFVAAAVDEQRRTGQELRQSLRLAAAGEMAATLTHELHHPLTALSAYAGACEQLLERGEVGERLHSAIRCVVRESARTSEVVHRLQGFFRSGSPELESVSLGELVDSAAAPYRLRAERSGIRLRIATMPDLTLRVDRLQVEVVLRSLLGFAFDAVSDSPRQPRRIWVAAWKDGHDRVCLRIEDSGSGLTPDQVLHLFEPIAPSGSGKRQSGLAISRAIVHSHGGRLWAETSNHGVLKCELPIERHTVAPLRWHRTKPPRRSPERPRAGLAPGRKSAPPASGRCRPRRAVAYWVLSPSKRRTQQWFSTPAVPASPTTRTRSPSAGSSATSATCPSTRCPTTCVASCRRRSTTPSCSTPCAPPPKPT